MSQGNRNRNPARKNRAGISTALSAITIELLGVILFLLLLSAIRQNHPTATHQNNHAEATWSNSGFEVSEPAIEPPRAYHRPAFSAGLAQDWLGIAHLRDSN